MSRSTGRNTDRPWVWLVLILAVSFGLRIWFAAQPRVVRWDEAGYQLIARSLHAGQGYYEVVGARDLQQPPVVAYLSLAGRVLGLPIPWATAALVHVLLGGLLPLPIYLLGKGIATQRVGLFAALLVAVHPALTAGPLYWGTMTEPPYLLFVVTGVYGAWRLAESPSWRWAAFTGALFGLAYLTRPEAAAYLAAMLVFVALRQLAVQRPFRAVLIKAGPALVLAPVVFVLVASPYVVYIYRVTGRWAFSGKQGISMDISLAYQHRSQAEHDKVVAALNPVDGEITWLSSRQYDVGLAGWIREDPRRFAALVRHNIGTAKAALMDEDLLSPWQLALIALGVFVRPWAKKRLPGQLLIVFALAPALALLVFFVLSRFLVIVVPFTLIWAGEGLDVIAAWGAGTAELLAADGLRRTPGVLRAVPAVLTGVIVIGLVWAGWATLDRERAKEPFWRVNAAAWLAANVPPGSPLMLRNSEVALYSGLPQVAFPNADWPQVLNYARTRGARYLVVEDREIRNIRPVLEPLLEQDGYRAFPGISPVTRLDEGGRTTLVFQFDP